MTPPTPRHPAQTDTLLFEQFATLATAPDGIARLRELILQLAVQGKLGTQDPGDEPASVLVGKIKKTRTRLEKEEKIKKGIIFAPIYDPEIPFTLPTKWSWIRVGFGLNLINGRAFKPEDWQTTGLPIVRIQNLNNIRAPFNYYDKEVEEKFHIHDDDLLIGWSGTPGTSFGAFIWDRGHAILNQHIFRVEIFGDAYFKHFLRLAINARLNEMISQAHGAVGLQHITKGKMENIPIPLPPLAEQHRIVAKVDRLMALCDELEARQQQERAGCLKLGTASLAGLQNAASPEEFEAQWAQVCDTFELILDCPENVAMLRQTILQLAVQGRLNTQDTKDEPAEKLVERIKKEKERLVKGGIIQKERYLDPVLEDEVPFTLPNNWIWIKWNDISLKIQDVDHRMPGACKEGIPYVSPRDFGPNNKIHFDTAKKISKADFDSLKTKVQPERNDIIFPRYGTIGENRFIETDIDFLASYSCTIIKNMNGFVHPKYSFYFSISPFARSQIEKSINKTTQANVGLKSIQNYLFPLPPLAEQHRIVAKVDALMALCDTLEARLKERAAVQGKFADAVAKQVAGT